MQEIEARNQIRHVGKDAIIREWIVFVRPENIIIGDYTMIDNFVLLSGGRDELTIIGNHVHIANFTNIQGSGGITMEDFTGLSPGCRLFSESDDYVGATMTNPTIPSEFHNNKIGRITLERFALLGANCVVLPGVVIGEGASVGACSLVNRDLEPWTVNVGIPARPIKKRDREGVLRRYEQFQERSRTA